MESVSLHHKIAKLCQDALQVVIVRPCQNNFLLPTINHQRWRHQQAPVDKEDEAFRRRIMVDVDTAKGNAQLSQFVFYLSRLDAAICTINDDWLSHNSPTSTICENSLCLKYNTKYPLLPALGRRYIRLRVACVGAEWSACEWPAMEWVAAQLSGKRPSCSRTGEKLLR